MNNYAANKLDRLLGQLHQGVTEIPFRQHGLLDPGDFVTYLRQRGFEIVPAHLEALEQGGLLFPLYGEVTRDPGSGQVQTHRYYHPFQLWFADRVFRILRLPLPSIAWWTSSEVDIGEMVRRHRRWVRSELARFSSDEEVLSYYKLILLLLILDPYYLPLIRGELRLAPGQTIYQWRAWRQQADVEAAYQESGLNLDELMEWHDKLVIGANRLDPVRRWHLVVRYASHAARQKLEGAALWAQDYYEMAEMLHRFAQDFLGQRLSTAAQVIFGPGDRIPGITSNLRELDFQSRQVLRPILAAFSLSPQYQTHWLVEDDLEASFLAHFIEGLGMSLEVAGITVIPLCPEASGGDAAAKLVVLEEWLSKVTPGASALATVSARPEVEAALRREKERGRLKDYHLWRGGFVEDNFPQEASRLVGNPTERGRQLAESLLKRRAGGPGEPSPLTPVERWLEGALAGRFGDFCLSPKPEEPPLAPPASPRQPWRSREGLLSPENAPYDHD